MTEEDRVRDHEQTLLRLLDELGRGLARQERLFEEIEGRHHHTRNAWVQGSAEAGAEEPEGQALVEELQWELDQRRNHELELHDILDVLRQRAGLQDQLLAELEPHLIDEHRDAFFGELARLVERRDRLLHGMEFRSFEEKRGGISETIDLMPELEGRLSEVLERHLVQRHRSGA